MLVKFTENPRKSTGNPRKSTGNPLEIYWKSKDVQRHSRKSI